MRDGIPMVAATHMDFIYETYRDLEAKGKKPSFVVVFMGGSVKLISSNRMGFSVDENKYLDRIAAAITKMSKAGIRLEVCLAAVNYFNIKPSSIQSGINHVANRWISEIGYQARGYNLVPVY
jgi:intracellular sulfur oxidation DsrE/DsrF family protein